MDHYGIRGIAKEWFRSYLSNRSQFVAINGTQSSHKPIIYGVPQGSILGPLLFVIYINDLPGISDLAKFILYADDANIIISGTSIAEITSHVNHITSLLVQWVAANGLALNLKKTCYMIFSKSKIRLPDFNISIDNTTIERKSEARFLGVIVDERLTWSKHISALKTKMARYLGIMYKIKGQLPEKARLLIFQSLVQSHINFCSLVWGFASKTLIEGLFAKQKQGIRAVTSGYVNYKYKDGAPPAHTKPYFAKHDILTVHNVVVKNALTLMHKVRYMPSTLPKSIREIFPDNIPNHESTHETCSEWLSTYNSATFITSLFYKGPMLSISPINSIITIPCLLYTSPSPRD